METKILIVVTSSDIVKVNIVVLAKFQISVRFTFLVFRIIQIKIHLHEILQIYS